MHSRDNILLGDFLVFVNAVSYGFYLILIKRLIAKHNPVNLLKWLFLFCLFILTPAALKEFRAIEWIDFTASISFSVVFTISGAGIFAIIKGSDSLNIVKIIATLPIFSGVYLVSKKTATNKA